MKIEVGSKWVLQEKNSRFKSTIIIKVYAITNDIVFYGLYDDIAEEYLFSGLKKNEFLKYFKLIEPKYEWVKLTSIKFGMGSNYLTIFPSDTKKHEILHNYDSYHKQLDNFNMNHVEKYYQVKIYENEYVLEVSGEADTPLGLYFSTKEHAENFIKLLEEETK